MTRPNDLFRNLFERGLVRPDELDMGIEVTPDFAVVDQNGRPSDYLFAIGPLLKGTLWETTAVPELRAQTHQVAQALLARDQRHQARLDARNAGKSRGVLYLNHLARIWDTCRPCAGSARATPTK